MRRISVFVMVIVAIGMIVTSCGKKVNTNVGLKSEADSAFYAIGVSVGSNLKDGLKMVPGTDGKVNYDAFLAGLVVALNDEVSQLKMTFDDAQQFLQTFYEVASIREMATTKAEGEAFLAANKTKEGVITTASGLQYKVITEGSGRKPAETDMVIVHYTGKFLDGTVFDTSLDRGEPATFGLGGGLIEGWKEGLPLMPVGSKYMFWVPSDLAYGEPGWQGQQGWIIKPNSMLEFEVELLGIQGEE